MKRVIHPLFKAEPDRTLVCRLEPRVPWLAAGKNAGSLNNFCDGFFLAVGHHMHPGNTFDFPDFLDKVNTNPTAFSQLVFSAIHSLDDSVWDVHPGEFGAHPFGCTGRP